MPWLWRSDANGNGRPDPAELELLWGVSHEPASVWRAADGSLTQRTKDALAALQAPAPAPAGDAREQRRRELVRLELAQGRPTLMQSDYRPASDQDRALLRHLMKAAEGIERLYARQKGVLGLDAKIPADDLASQMLFYRNQGPRCVAPATEKEAGCGAIPDLGKLISGLYPKDLQEQPKFCEQLTQQKDAALLMTPFTAVERGPTGTFRPVPYAAAFKEEMEPVAVELDAAAAVITDPKEAAFKGYLSAAASAFRSNDWEAANEAWVKMNAKNSAWYLRVAPDETYFEPCAEKAGFALALARISPESLAWQAKLDPVKAEMEKAVAELAGPPYKARDVKFQLPDFIELLLNAGDSRFPISGIAGQSLPNWGKVAARGGRTVAMVNIISDVDSMEALRDQNASVFCAETAARVPLDPAPQMLSTVLHEASHNLGPSHEYKVKGKTGEEVFGGPLAATMEELKAQTAALYFSDWLVDRNLLTAEEAARSHLRELVWGFGQISRGLYSPEGASRPYGHLASIQLGWLHRDGVLVWDPQAKAANGKDVGCFNVKLEGWRPSVLAMAKVVLAAKGRGDRAAAEKLKAEFVDAKSPWAELREIALQRWLRAPRPTFVYAADRGQ